MAHPGPRSYLGQRGDVDHRSAAPLEHARHQGRCQRQWGPEVELEGVPALVPVAHAPLRSTHSAAGVVNQNVDRAERILDLGRQSGGRAPLSQIGDVNRWALGAPCCELFSQRLQQLPAAGGDGEPCAPPAELTSELPPDATGGTGHQHASALQSCAHHKNLGGLL